MKQLPYPPYPPTQVIPNNHPRAKPSSFPLTAATLVAPLLKSKQKIWMILVHLVSLKCRRLPVPALPQADPETAMVEEGLNFQENPWEEGGGYPPLLSKYMYISPCWTTGTLRPRLSVLKFVLQL